MRTLKRDLFVAVCLTASMVVAPPVVNSQQPGEPKAKNSNPTSTKSPPPTKAPLPILAPKQIKSSKNALAPRPLSSSEFESWRQRAVTDLAKLIAAAPAARLYSEATSKFGLDLLAQLARKTASPNIFISPFCVSNALTLALSGADGDTRNEIQRVLHLDAATLDKVPAAYQTITNAMQLRTSSSKFHTANGLFVQNNFKIKGPFLQTAKTKFGTEVQSIDFASPAAIGKVNDWVNKNTSGKIPRILGALDPSTRLMIANAVYFKAPWERPFSAMLTQPGPFFVQDSQSKKIPFLNQSETFPYFENADVQLIELPYQWPSSASMLVFLPRPGQNVRMFASALSQNWFTWRGKVKPTYVHLSLPKFKTDYSSNLAYVLAQLGMKSAFDRTRANFNGITDERVSIGQVIHKTYLDVNEQGTEAAAAVAMPMPLSAPPQRPEPVEMKVDRPFIVAIVENKTKAIVFIGVITDPTN